MKPNRPWNVWGMDVANIIRTEMWGEVTSPLMYEPSTNSFHPNGLYSELIFGQIGTVERISRLGYISLHCDILSPIIYLNMLNVCGWYQDIMEGKVNAVYDISENAFSPVEKDHPEGNTGFAFFMTHVSDLKFKRNNSVSRNNKISVIEKMIAEKTHIIRQYPVCPAGWRDVKSDGSGKIEVDEVNKIYNALLMMSMEIKNGLSNPILIPFFNNVKYHIQLKVVEIFNHWKTFYEGKTGFGQAHYAKRNLALGTRGVITAPPLLAESPESPDYIKHNETQVSLYHGAKAAEPIVVHHLNALFTSQVFTQGSINVPAIDKKTLEIVYVEVSPSTITYALDSKSKHDFINGFEDPAGRNKPVTITDIKGDEYWLWMVYDLGDSIYMFRGLKDLETLLTGKSSSLQLALTNCPILTEDYIKPHWDKIIAAYKQKNIDLSKMTFGLSTVPISTDGHPMTDLDPIKFGGCWTNAKKIYFNPEFRRVIGHYTKSSMIDGIEAFDWALENLIAHELAHEVYTNVAAPNEIRQVIDLATQKGFTTDYLESVSKTDMTKYNKELYCEWMALQVNPVIETTAAIDRTKLRPLTRVEMLYLATFAATHSGYTTVTRFPAVETGSIYPSQVVILTTSPSRIVTFKSQYLSDVAIELPHYPNLSTNIYSDAVTIHPSKTTGMGADYDGDKINVNFLLTTEATAEAKAHLNSPMSIISPAGKFYDTVNTNAVRFTLHALTMLQSDELPTAE